MSFLSKKVLWTALLFSIMSVVNGQEGFYRLDCGSRLNIRIGPGKDHKAVDSIACGDFLSPSKVMVLSYKSEWSQIYHNNKSLYVSSKYLSPMGQTIVDYQGGDFERELIERDEIPEEWVDHEISRIDEYLNSDINKEGLGVDLNTAEENIGTTAWPGDVNVYEIDTLGYEE